MPRQLLPPFSGSSRNNLAGSILPFTLMMACLLAVPAAASAQSVTAAPLVGFPATNLPGTSPQSSVIQALDGFFYGTTDGDTTTCNCGTVFSYSAITGPALEYQFTAADTHPFALTQAPNGLLWGTTEGGGSDGFGMVYILNGSLTINALYSFANGADGGRPAGPLTLGSDGNFWGVTGSGGKGYGTIYKIAPHNGALTTVYTFLDTTDGKLPTGAMVQGTDGAFYGALEDAPGSSDGGIFRITTGGAYSVYSTFSGQTDAQFPAGNMAFLANGTLLGTAADGGTGDGILYRTSTAGVQTAVETFDGLADGGFPADGLFAASDGNFYGTTEGDQTFGNLFAISPAFAFSSVYEFDNGAVGGTPSARPIQGSDGDFYGTTTSGGENSGGTLYRLTPPVAFAAPVSMTLSSAIVKTGAAVTVTGVARNAAAVSSQICYAYGGGTEIGQLSGSLSGTTWTGTLSAMAPTTAGSYTYAVTCAGQLSGYAPLDVTPDGKAATTLALSATPNPVYGGANITFTGAATRMGTSGVPTGTVTFYLGSDAFATATLVNGVATLTAPSSDVPYGTYNIYAVYGGDSQDDPSTSSTVTVISAPKVASTTTLKASSASVAANGTDTLTATVSATNGTPTGTVTFTSSGYTIGTVTLSGGIAKLTASAGGVPAGSYAVYAKYNGDSSRDAGTAAPVTVTVQ